jgi:hypothetical protein
MWRIRDTWQPIRVKGRGMEREMFVAFRKENG